MLVLSRKVGEKILIGENVTVTIVRVSGDKVRIGIEAPQDVTVLRDELKLHPQETTANVSGNVPPGDGAPVAPEVPAG